MVIASRKLIRVGSYQNNLCKKPYGYRESIDIKIV